VRLGIAVVWCALQCLISTLFGFHGILSFHGVVTCRRDPHAKKMIDHALVQPCQVVIVFHNEAFSVLIRCGPQIQGLGESQNMSRMEQEPVEHVKHRQHIAIFSHVFK
jgi:hypothetical protein